MRIRPGPLLRAIGVVVALVLVGAACSGGDDAVTTMSVPGDDVELGSGAVPETVPDDFPIPEQAVVGSTLVDPSSGVTEMILRVPSTIEASIVYYEQNLEARDYIVVSSGADDASTWTIEFERDDLSGTIRMTSGGTEITELVVRLQE